MQASLDWCSARQHELFPGEVRQLLLCLHNTGTVPVYTISIDLSHQPNSVDQLPAAFSQDTWGTQPSSTAQVGAAAGARPVLSAAAIHRMVQWDPRALQSLLPLGPGQKAVMDVRLYAAPISGAGSSMLDQPQVNILMRLEYTGATPAEAPLLSSTAIAATSMHAHHLLAARFTSLPLRWRTAAGLQLRGLDLVRSPAPAQPSRPVHAQQVTSPQSMVMPSSTAVITTDADGGDSPVAGGTRSSAAVNTAAADVLGADSWCDDEINSLVLELSNSSARPIRITCVLEPQSSMQSGKCTVIFSICLLYTSPSPRD